MMEESKKESKEKYEFKQSRFIILTVIQIAMAVFGYCSIAFLPSVFRNNGVRDDAGPYIFAIYALTALIVTVLSGIFISHWIREYIMADLIAVSSWMILCMISLITGNSSSSLITFIALIVVSILIAAYMGFQAILLLIVKIIKTGGLAKFIDI